MPAPGVAKAEWTKDEANPRFVVPRSACRVQGSLSLREGLLRRGDMENRIKECQLDLYADRTSTATCGQTSCACGLPRWPMCCCAPCAASPAPHAVRQSDAAPFVSSCSRSVRSCASGPPHQGCDGVSVSGSPYLGLRCQASRRCRQRAGLARLTHVAATRNPRGITSGPSETASRLS